MSRLLPRRRHVRELDAAADAVQAQPALLPDGTPPAPGERGRSMTSPVSPHPPLVGEHRRCVRLPARRVAGPCGPARRTSGRCIANSMSSRELTPSTPVDGPA